MRIVVHVSRVRVLQLHLVIVLCVHNCHCCVVTFIIIMFVFSYFSCCHHVSMSSSLCSCWTFCCWYNAQLLVSEHVIGVLRVKRLTINIRPKMCSFCTIIRFSRNNLTVVSCILWAIEADDFLLIILKLSMHSAFRKIIFMYIESKKRVTITEIW